MRYIDKHPSHDDWLLRDAPDDEPLTEDERREQREDERDRRWVEEMFR